MKLVITIISADKLEIMKTIADKFGGSGMTMTSVMGCGTQKGKKTDFKGVVTEINLLPKVKVEMYVKDEVVDELLNAIQREISTGNIGDGKVCVINIDDLMRIRTGERGEKAL
ncbi:MAG: P-II family nitrogen regulator [Candidatus Metalachnospira sp.]|nr:P-II family nitrogen regulator [Candidatus Metalachnospira sp.]